MANAPADPQALEREVRALRARVLELERERAERVLRELRAGEERYRAVFEANRDAMGVFAPDGSLIEINSAYHEMHGYTREEFLRLSPHQFVHPDSLDTFDRFRREILAGQPFHCHAKNLHRDGRAIDIEVHGWPFQQDGRLLLLAVIRDISKQLRTEDELRQLNAELELRVAQRTKELHESESRFRTLIANIPGAIYRCRYDEDWTMIFLSEEIESLVGYPASDFLGNASRSYAGLIHVSDREQVRRRVDDAVRGHASYDLEYRIVHRDGEVRWVYEKGQAIFEEDGTVRCLDGAVFDVTQRRRALAEIDRIFEVSLELLCVATMGGFYTRVNPAFRRVLGYREEELTERAFIEFVHPDDREMTLSEMTALRQGRPSVGFENRHLAHDGTIRWLSWTAMPVGEEGLIYAAARDVTEHKATQRRIETLQNELAHVARLSTMGEMATTMAHELNQPLQAVRNYVQGCLLRMRSSGVERPDVVEAMKQVSAEAQRAGEIITRLRRFVRKRAPSSDVLDLNEIVREVVQLVEPEAKRDEVGLRFEPTDDLPRIVGDRIQIEQVLVNLVRNGLDAAVNPRGRTPRRVTVSTEPDGRAVRVVVRDTGRGIAPEHESKLFEPFFTTKREGMGMGLSICRTIVEAHGGRLEHVREDGSGATFRFSLPTEEAAPH